jgi:hypothetical protein
MDTPIDPVTREPVTPVDTTPAPDAETPPRIEILLLQGSAEVKDEDEAQRAVIVKSSRREQPALEIYFTGTKAMGLDIARALAKPKAVVARTGPVAWDI